MQERGGKNAGEDVVVMSGRLVAAAQPNHVAEETHVCEKDAVAVRAIVGLDNVDHATLARRRALQVCLGKVLILNGHAPRARHKVKGCWKQPLHAPEDLRQANLQWWKGNGGGRFV